MSLLFFSKSAKLFATELWPHFWREMITTLLYTFFDNSDAPCQLIFYFLWKFPMNISTAICENNSYQYLYSHTPSPASTNHRKQVQIQQISFSPEPVQICPNLYLTRSRYNMYKSLPHGKLVQIRTNLYLRRSRYKYEQYKPLSHRKLV